VNSLFFLISLVAPNGEVDPHVSRLVISGTVMSKIINKVGTGLKAKPKFVYDNTIHCFSSIRNTHLNTSSSNLIASQHTVMPRNNSHGHRTLSSPFMSQQLAPFVPHLSHNTLAASSTELAMNIPAFGVLSELNTFYDGLYGTRTVSGTAPYAVSNTRGDPFERYATDNVMENKNLDGMDEFGAM
jgi:hypothetical protein